jgi:hypothetical protein
VTDDIVDLPVSTKFLGITQKVWVIFTPGLERKEPDG